MADDIVKFVEVPDPILFVESPTPETMLDTSDWSYSRWGEFNWGI
jgi:hypothetical protein